MGARTSQLEVRMNRLLATITPLLVLIPFLGSAQDEIPGEVIVQYDETVPMTAFATSMYGQTIHTPIYALDRIVLRRGVSTASVLAHLRATPGVVAAEPNRRWRLLTTGTAPTYPWEDNFVRYSKTWPSSTGKGVIIAIIDTGVNYNHPDLKSNCLRGADFTGKGTWMDDNGHGTHCAGIAAGAVDLAHSFCGVAPGANILPVKVIAANGTGTTDHIASGIKWAVDHGARVLSMSFGGPTADTILANACAYAISHDAVLVAAAGNDGSSAKTYPAAFPSVLSVGAIDSTGTLANFSQNGSWVTIAAPGYNVLSTFQNTFAYMSGTSMACPFVSGAAALNWPYYKSGAKVRAALLHGATPLNGIRGIGGGEVNAYNTWWGLDGGAGSGGASGAAPNTTAFPASYGIVYGTGTNTIVTNLAAADKSLWQMKSALVNKQSLADAYFSFIVTAPLQNQMTVTGSGITLSTGWTNATVSVFNYKSSSWDRFVTSTPSVSGFTSFAFNVANASNFLSATSNTQGQMLVRISFIGTTPFQVGVDLLSATSINAKS